MSNRPLFFDKEHIYFPKVLETIDGSFKVCKEDFLTPYGWVMNTDGTALQLANTLRRLDDEFEHLESPNSDDTEVSKAIRSSMSTVTVVFREKALGFNTVAASGLLQTPLRLQPNQLTMVVTSERSSNFAYNELYGHLPIEEAIQQLLTVHACGHISNYQRAALDELYLPGGKKYKSFPPHLFHIVKS